MPTPSPNPPPGPSSPPPYAFSTCPDDVQQSPHPTRQTHAATQLPETGALHLEPSSSVDGPSPSSSTARASADDIAAADALMLGSGASVEPSSRATTVSPGPNSSVTGVTSPAPSAPDGDISKGHGIAPDGPLSHMSAAPVSRSRPSPDGTSGSSLYRDFDSADSTLYDDDDDRFSSPSMGSDVPNLRVSRDPLPPPPGHVMCSDTGHH